MDRRSLYYEDIHAWAQQQAATLRRLAQTRGDLPNELDLEHVAEEIESVGRSELNKVESFLRVMLIHLIKVASAPQARSQRKWRNEILAFQADLRKEITPSMRGQIDIDHAWRLAALKAEGDLSEHDDALAAHLPNACPFSLDDLTSEAFDLDEAVARLAAREG